MSNTSTLLLGLGSGAALWYVTKNKGESAPAASSASSSTAPSALPATASASGATTATARRNCSVRIESAGITVDGARVELAEAIRRCAAVGCASVTVTPTAPASLYAELMTALGGANIPTVRNARTRNIQTMTNFTLRYYPEGRKGTSKMRWFRAEAPITWAEARDRLIAAGIVDPSVGGRTHEAGGWMLSIDKHQFQPDRAEPLPGANRPRGAARTTQRYTREGRTILRDGEAILYVDRVDLGDERYAISPHDADRLTERMVRLLNRHGAR